jgi:integrase/recombinase XerD
MALFMPLVAQIMLKFGHKYSMFHIQNPKKQPKRQLRWQTALRKLEGAYADGTLRAYRADIQTYEAWCKQNNHPAFPGKPKHLAAFVKHEAEQCSTSTIRRRLAAIGKIHRLMKFDNPVMEEDVKLALRREMRKKSTRPKQALGLTRDIRDKLIKACDNSLAGKRDKAIIALGYDTLARRSEIVSICLEDITAGSKLSKVIIKRSKNDQLGIGRIAHISVKTNEIIREWLRAAQISDGPLFRAIKNDNVKPNALHPNSIGIIIKQAAKRAGLTNQEVQKLSGHSMRIGAAQDMMTAGLDILPIMAAGGWKTMNVVARYIENADLSPLLNKFLQQ